MDRTSVARFAVGSLPATAWIPVSRPTTRLLKHVCCDRSARPAAAIAGVVDHRHTGNMARDKARQQCCRPRLHAHRPHRRRQRSGDVV
jgi:hypothetical protein